MAEPRIDGYLQFNITATPQEMRHWPAHRIAQFFNGVARIVRAAGRNATFEITHRAPLTARKQKESD